MQKKGHERARCPFLIEKEDNSVLSIPFRAGFEFLVNEAKIEIIDSVDCIQWHSGLRHSTRQVLSVKVKLLQESNELLTQTRCVAERTRIGLTKSESLLVN